MGLLHFNALLATSDASLVTTGSNLLLSGVFAVNATASPATLNLSVTRAAGAPEPLASALPVGAGQAVQVVEDRLTTLGGVFLHPGDSLRGSASAPATVNLLVFE